MIIPITDNWRLVADRHCWSVQRYSGVFESGHKANKSKYKTQGYYSSIDSALIGLAKLIINDADTDGHAQAIAVAERTAKIINEAVLRAAENGDKIECPFRKD